MEVLKSAAPWGSHLFGCINSFYKGQGLGLGLGFRVEGLGFRVLIYLQDLGSRICR